MYLFPVATAVIMTLANSSNFLAGVWRTKPDEIYLGTTHYFEDYFLYVSQFLQGARGGWLTLNRYTSESTPASILFWPNILLGKIGGFMGLSPQISYNASVMLLSFAFLIILSRLMAAAFPKDKIKTAIGFLLASISTSLINYIRSDGRGVLYPFQQEKTPNFAFDRLGAVPHQLVQTILFLLAVHAFFFLRAKKSFVLLISLVLIVLLTSLNPVMSGLFLVAAWGAGRRDVYATVMYLIVTFYYHTLANQQPHVQSKLWEASQQFTSTPLFMLLSIGPISVLGMIGAFFVIKSNQAGSRFAGHVRPIHIFSIVLLAFGYLLYFTPIPKLIGISNSRVLFPGMYAAWGILGAEGLVVVSNIMRRTSRNMLSLSTVHVLLLTFFIIISIPTLRWELGQKLAVKPEERTPLLYIPKRIYQTFAYLKNQRSIDDIVLANPASHMDALVPALAGHTGYTGHPFATTEHEKKRAEATNFFQLRMNADDARAWLKKNRVSLILFTDMDGDAGRFHSAYPFLIPVFTTTRGNIYHLRDE